MVVTFLLQLFNKYDTIITVLPENGRRLALVFTEGDFLKPSDSNEKGADMMVTYSELFQFCLLIVSIIGLVIKVSNKKK